MAPDTDPASKSGAHEVAAAMEMARRHIEGLTTTELRTREPDQTRIVSSYAFAFDIDGVLIKGGEPIPQAVQAMRMLNGESVCCLGRGCRVADEYRESRDE